MTREEATRIIKECKDKGFKYTFYTLAEYHTAIDMAIKALEQEPCKDAISRQAVIQAVDSHTNDDGTLDDDISCILEPLPPVTPQPKTGHWIEDDITYCGVELVNYKCDKCGEIGGSWRKGLKPDKLPKYCMNCGARMFEPQESEEWK